MHALRTKAGNRRQRSKGRRGARLDFCQGLKMPRVDDLGDLAGEVLADPRQPDQSLALGDHLCHALRQVLDGLSRATISSNAKWICPFDLKQIGNAPQRLCDARIVYRHVPDTQEEAEDRHTIKRKALTGDTGPYLSSSAAVALAALGEE